MSHEIDTLAYSERGGSVWHGLGVPLNDSVDARTMIEQAGLDWEVEPTKLFTRTLEHNVSSPDVWRYAPVRDTKAMIRNDTGAVLGTVSDGYQAIQNRILFEFGDALQAASDEPVRYHSAGSLEGGRQTFVLAELGNGWTIGDDRHRKYLFTKTRHDGNGSMNSMGTDTRVICANTSRFAEDGADVVVRVTHTGNVMDKVSQAIAALNIVNKQAARYQEMMEQFATTNVNLTTEVALSEYLYPKETTHGRTKRNEFMNLVIEELGHPARRRDDSRATAYDLYNAATGMANHRGRYVASKARNRTVGEARIVNVLDGRGNELAQDAATYLSAVANGWDLPVRTLADKGQRITPGTENNVNPQIETIPSPKIITLGQAEETVQV
jgi:phage/plasmid-like protein (TIGR03299 family)